MSTFSERILKLKKEKNLLQKDIAENISVSLRSYQDYEYGKMEPKMSNLVALADYFDVSLDYLVGRSDDPTRH